jgi:PAS domain S-box-containing protein
LAFGGFGVSKTTRLLAQLKAERSRLLAAQAVAKVGSWEVDLPNFGLYWSEEMHRIFQTDASRSEASFVDFFSAVHPEDRARVEQILRDAPSGDTRQACEFRLLFPGGIVKTLDMRWKLLRDATGHAVRMLGTCHDISERNTAENALRASHALENIAARLGRIGAWSFDCDRERVEWSPMVCIIHEMPLGYSPTLEEGVAFYLPEWRGVISSAAEACIAHGTPFDLELQILTARKRVVWVRAVGEAVRDEAGKVSRIQGAFQDITERKDSERDVQLLANRLAHTLDSITIPFFTVDREWRFTYLNRYAQSMASNSAEARIGRLLWDAFPGLCSGPFEPVLRSAMLEKLETAFDGIGRIYSHSSSDCPCPCAKSTRSVKPPNTRDCWRPASRRSTMWSSSPMLRPSMSRAPKYASSTTLSPA